MTRIRKRTISWINYQKKKTKKAKDVRTGEVKGRSQRAVSFLNTKMASKFCLLQMTELQELLIMSNELSR